MNHTGTEAAMTSPVPNVKRLPILIALIIGAFFSILNETLLNVAFQRLSEDLQVPYTTITWLSTGYLLIVGILVPISAILVQWFTTRQMFIGALIFFTLGTLVSGIAPHFGWLLCGRLIQAFGAGLMLPVMMNTVLLLYPPENRGAAMGSIGLVIMFAPAVGPTIGGLILDELSWRWLFFLVLPFMLLSIVIAFLFLKNVSVITRPKVNVIAILLSTVGFGGIVYGFSSAGELEGGGWSSPEVLVSLALGGIALILLIATQLKSKQPMLDFRVFRYPMFSIAVILVLIVMMTMFSTLLLLPIYMQGAMLLTAFASGLVLLPGGVLNGLFSPVAGKLFDKFGPRKLIIPGCLLLIGVMYGFTRVTLETNVSVIILLHCVMMIAISLIMMPVQTNAMNGLAPHHYPHGTALFNTLQQVAGAIGMAFFMSILESKQKEYLETAANPTYAEAINAGIHASFTIGLVFAVIAFLLSLTVRKTIVPHK
jgi:DHA2 family lincomycin resistance protein-like MFS transporter